MLPNCITVTALSGDWEPLLDLHKYCLYVDYNVLQNCEKIHFFYTFYYNSKTKILYDSSLMWL